MKQKPKNSLEDAIRFVQTKYKNRPSPIQTMNENVGFVPTQVPDHMRSPQDLRGNLIGNFRPFKDTFR
jgi:hypothetical protein